MGDSKIKVLKRGVDEANPSENAEKAMFALDMGGSQLDNEVPVRFNRMDGKKLKLKREKAEKGVKEEFSKKRNVDKGGFKLKNRRGFKLKNRRGSKHKNRGCSKLKNRGGSKLNNKGSVRFIMLKMKKIKVNRMVDEAKPSEKAEKAGWKKSWKRSWDRYKQAHLQRDENLRRPFHVMGKKIGFFQWSTEE